MQPLTAASSSNYRYNHIVENAAERRSAQERFENAINSARRKRLWAKLTGQCRELLHLSTLCPSHDLHYAGVRPVTLSHIVGSENRRSEFDRDFYPAANHLEIRWVNLAVAMLVGAALPPVVLIQAGDAYYVRDGHHRVSVARALGQHEIDAEVLILCE